MKVILLVMALVMGGYMLADGIYVIIKGKYIGPEKPGPWSAIFEKLHVNVFSLGPLFIFFGVAWLIFMAGIGTGSAWARMYGMVLSIFSLWYLPVGTIIAIITFLILLRYTTH
jgi:hypothetical protein